MKWFRKRDPRETIVPKVVEVDVLPGGKGKNSIGTHLGADIFTIPDDGEMLEVLDDALTKHVMAESKALDSAYIYMLTQTEEPKMGLLVETIYHDSGDADDNNYTVEFETVISLSADVPFGEVHRRDRFNTIQ